MNNLAGNIDVFHGFIIAFKISISLSVIRNCISRRYLIIIIQIHCYSLLIEIHLHRIVVIQSMKNYYLYYFVLFHFYIFDIID